jgi:hypothetical protein
MCINEKYIKFNRHDLSIAVVSKKSAGTTSFRASPWKGDLVSHPLSLIVYHDVLYPAIEARDKRLGRKCAYCLVPPDPWLVGIAMVMWEGIVQGMAWDSLKIIVKKAYQVMADEGLAPVKTPITRIKKSKTELGFEWIQYKDGRKQYQLFLGLRRAYNKKEKMNVNLLGRRNANQIKLDD